MKLDSSGSVIWSRIVTGVASNIAFSLAIDSSNNIFIGTYASATGMRIIKFDSSGNIIWQNILNSSAVEQPAGMVTDSKNNIYFYTGQTTNDRVNIFYLPGDGTKTGTYVNTDTFTYSTSSLTAGIGALTPTTFSAVTNTTTPTVTTSGITAQSVALTVAKVIVT